MDGIYHNHSLNANSLIIRCLLSYCFCYRLHTCIETAFQLMWKRSFSSDGFFWYYHHINVLIWIIRNSDLLLEFLIGHLNFNLIFMSLALNLWKAFGLTWNWLLSEIWMLHCLFR